jgi:hypothetical protein
MLDDREIVREQHFNSRKLDSIGDRSTRRHRCQAARLGLPRTTLISRMQKRGITGMTTSSLRSITKRASRQYAKTPDACVVGYGEAALKNH